MKLSVLVITSLFLAGMVNADVTIYHWVDAQGNDHFSNVPAPDAENEVVDVSHINIYTDTTEYSDSQPPGQNQQSAQSKPLSQNQGANTQQGRPPMEQGGDSSDASAQNEMMPPPPPDMVAQ